MPAPHGPYHHSDLRRQLIASALEIISAQGVASLTMRELSRINDVSRMAAYRHFKNKHDLLCAVAEEGFRIIAERYQAIVAQTRADALETLEALGRAYVAFALENPALYRLMFGSLLTREERPPSMREMAGQAFGHLPATVALCQAQGRIRPGSSLALASTLWSTMHGLATLLMDGQLQTENYEDGFPIFLTADLGRQQKYAGKVLDAVVEVLFQGLVPRPQAPTTGNDTRAI
jgi:AcrR family transcriptional regulator